MTTDGSRSPVVTSSMAKWLLAASVALPLVLGAAVWQRASGAPADWTRLVYLAASRVCHQQPERSFKTSGVQWPVCARCSGLYLGGALGGLLLLGASRRAIRAVETRGGPALAAVPTCLAVVVEWGGLLPVDNLIRTTAAVPLGGAIAVAIISVAASGRSPAIG